MEKSLERKLYKVSEFARIAGVDYETALRWVNRGYIPAIRVGQRWYIPLDVVYQMAQRRVGQGENIVPVSRQAKFEEPTPEEKEEEKGEAAEEEKA